MYQYNLISDSFSFYQIIFRARRNYLMEKYSSENHSPEKTIEDVESSLQVNDTHY